MSTEVREDHFFTQFSRYAEGQERFEAACKHAAFILQCHNERNANQLKLVKEWLQLLVEGKTVQVAIEMHKWVEEETS